MRNGNTVKRRSANDLDERGRRKYESGLALCGIILAGFTVLHFVVVSLLDRQFPLADGVTIVLMAAALPVVKRICGICELPKCLGVLLDPEQKPLPKRLLLYGADALTWGAVIALAMLFYGVIHVRSIPAVFAAVTVLRYLAELLLKEGAVRKYSNEQKKQEAEENDLS